MNHQILFTFAPYVAFAILIAGVLYRLAAHQDPPAGKMERRRLYLLFAKESAWRVGITAILLGHLGAFLIPEKVLVWNQHPVRLLVLELTGMAFAGLAVSGLVRGGLALKREAPQAGLSRPDAVLLTALVMLVVSGLATAFWHRWGSTWAVSTVVPYVRSLFLGAPEAHLIVALPFLVRLHVLAFFVALASLPYSSFGVLLAGTTRQSLRQRRRRRAAALARG